jgi:hypothetical protein
LRFNTTGEQNTAVGLQALHRNTTASNNTAVGRYALEANTTGTNNTAVGSLTLDAATTGASNTAVGQGAMTTTTTGGYNAAVGAGALNDNTTGANNIAMGYLALRRNTTGTDHTVVGARAGEAVTTGSGNTFLGRFAGFATTTGHSNVFIGYRTNGEFGAGHLVTTGSKNTIIGGYSGNQGGLDIRTSSNNIVLSDGDGNPRVHVDSSGVISMTSVGAGSLSLNNTNNVSGDVGIFQYLGSNCSNTSSVFFSGLISGVGNKIYIYGNGNIVNTNNSYGAISDLKLKENITDASSQWDDIKALTVRKYSLKADNLDAPNMLGVIAQEVEAAGMGGLVYESPDLDRDNNDLGTVTKQVNYSILYMKAVKALQEAMTRIESLEERITTLEG